MEIMTERLWTRRKMLEELGGSVSRSASYLIPDFPKPISLPGNKRSKYFIASEVEAWLKKTVAASRGANTVQQSAASRAGEQSDRSAAA
jgi:predicted DNA-binding transcriptional regulator AlpA